MSNTTFAELDNPTTVDASACRFTENSKVQFMDGGSDDIKHPIKMAARSDQAIWHDFWGMIVHDLSGIRFMKPKIVVDYCHNDREIIGYLDKSEIADGNFNVSGFVVRQPGRAQEVVTNGQHEVPYESSIYFDPDFGMVIEQVGEGASVEVNGFIFEGPGVVVRECVLRAVSICPHGRDPHTSTEFSQSNQPVSIKYKEGTVSKTKETKETAPTDNNETTSDVTELSAKVESLESSIGNIETMLSKIANNGEEPITDLPTALKEIESLKGKLSKATEQPAGDEGKGGENEPSTKTEFAAAMEELEKKMLAKFQHSQNSDSDGVSGGSEETSGKGKGKWSDNFRFANSPKQKDAEA